MIRPRSCLRPGAEWHKRRAALVAELTAKGADVTAVGGDVADEDDMRAAFDALEAAFDGVDVVVNTAGVPRSRATC